MGIQSRYTTTQRTRIGKKRGSVGSALAGGIPSSIGDLVLSAPLTSDALAIVGASPIGTLFGDAAFEGGALKCAFPTPSGVTFNGLNLSQLGNQWCIRIDVKPTQASNFADTLFHAGKTGAGNKNRKVSYSFGDGNLAGQVFAADTSSLCDAQIAAENLFSTSAFTTYELNCDSSGVKKLWARVAGSQVGALNCDGTQDGDMNLFVIGSDIGLSVTAQVYVKNLQVFKAVQNAYVA